MGAADRVESPRIAELREGGATSDTVIAVTKGFDQTRSCDLIANVAEHHGGRLTGTYIIGDQMFDTPSVS